MKKKIVNITMSVALILAIGWSIGYYCGEYYTKEKNNKEMSDLKSENLNLKIQNTDYKEMFVSYENKIRELNSNNTNVSSNTNNNTYTFTAGVYTIGKDIEAGTYDVEWVSGNGIVSWDGKNIHSELMGSRDGYIKRYSNMTVENSVEFEVTSDLKVKLVKK